MEPSTTRLLGPARIVALALIALALGARLPSLLLRLGEVSVPQGAHAGQLTLQACRTDEERRYAADCGTLVVPENRHDSRSRLIALPVKRIRARSHIRREPVFRLQGGPGLTNMDFPDASRFAGDRDVVLVGYRGVDGSSVLDCPEAESVMKHARDLLGAPYYARYGKGYPTAPGACRRRRRPRRLLAARARRRPRGRAARPRLPPDRPAQRERGHPHGDDLRLALPAEHRPLGDGRRQPARQLPLVPADDRRADPQVRRALRAATTPAARARTTSPRRCERRRGHPGPLVVPADQARQHRVGAFFGLMNATSDALAALGPQTIDTWLPPPRATRAGCGCCR